MPESVLLALVGVGGTVVGAVATALVAKIIASSKHRPDQPDQPDQPETRLVAGKAVNVRELRILRALFGEPKGRWLEAYKDAYRLPLEAAVNKGWAQAAQGRYYLTPVGEDFCRVY